MDGASCGFLTMGDDKLFTPDIYIRPVKDGFLEKLEGNLRRSSFCSFVSFQFIS